MSQSSSPLAKFVSFGGAGPPGPPGPQGPQGMQGVTGVSGAQFMVTHVVGNTNFTSVDVGSFYVGFSALTANRICALPTSPPAGMVAYVGIEDNSLNSFTVQVTGGATNIQNGIVNATTYTISLGQDGEGPVIGFLYTGTQWKKL